MVVAGGMDNCCAVAGAGVDTIAGREAGSAGSAEVAAGAKLVNISGTFEHLSGTIWSATVPRFVCDAGAFAFRGLRAGEAVACSRTTVGRQLRELTRSGGISPDYLVTGVAPGPSSFGPEAREDVDRLLDRSCFEMRRFLDLYQQAVAPVESITVVGGGAGSRAALQRKANVLGKRLVIPRETEASVMGALMVAWCALFGRARADAAAEAGARGVAGFANPTVSEVEFDPGLHEAFSAAYEEYLQG